VVAERARAEPARMRRDFRISTEAGLDFFLRYRRGVSWEIAGQIGPHSEPGVDGSGWLWELHRGEDAHRVFVEVSGSALSSNNVLSSETARAIETEGRSEIERIAELDDPPRVIKCSTHGVRDIYPDELE
jgi:hypothetical protein